MPRDISYNKSELISADTGFEEEEGESDLDYDVEESDEDPKEQFMREAEGLFSDAFLEQKKPPNYVKNQITELKSLKLTYNQENNAVIEAILPLILNSVKSQDGKKKKNSEQMTKDIMSAITEWKALLKEFSVEVEDQNYLIEECEIHCSMEEEFNNKFHIIMECLHQNVISGETIVKWCRKACDNLERYKDILGTSKGQIKDQPEGSNKFDEIDPEEKDEVLEVVGLEKREAFQKSMQKFLDKLDESSSDEDDSSSEDDKPKPKGPASPAKKPAK